MNNINVSNIMQAHKEAEITVLRNILLENSSPVRRFIRTVRQFHEQHGCRALVFKPHKLETELRYTYLNDEEEDADTVDWLPDIYDELSITDLITALRPELICHGVDCSVATDLHYDTYIVFSKGDPQFKVPT